MYLAPEGMSISHHYNPPKNKYFLGYTYIGIDQLLQYCHYNHPYGKKNPWIFEAGSWRVVDILSPELSTGKTTSWVSGDDIVFRPHHWTPPNNQYFLSIWDCRHIKLWFLITGILHSIMTSLSIWNWGLVICWDTIKNCRRQHCILFIWSSVIFHNNQVDITSVGNLPANSLYQFFFWKGVELVELFEEKIWTKEKVLSYYLNYTNLYILSPSSGKL